MRVRLPADARTKAMLRCRLRDGQPWAGMAEERGRETAAVGAGRRPEYPVDASGNRSRVSLPVSRWTL